MTTHLTTLLTNLDDLKLSDIKHYDNAVTGECDTIIIATARSSTHLNSSAENVKLDAKQLGLNIIGIEGVGSNWAIVDLAYIVVHIMLGDAREYYELDKLYMA